MIDVSSNRINTGALNNVSGNDTAVGGQKNQDLLHSLKLEGALTEQLSQMKAAAAAGGTQAANGNSNGINVDERLRTILDEPYDDDAMMRYGYDAHIHSMEMDMFTMQDRAKDLKSEIKAKMPEGPERDAALTKVDSYVSQKTAVYQEGISELKAKIAQGDLGTGRPRTNWTF